MSIITLTTDYGLKDYFVGALKGKIYSEFAAAKIVDISHDIFPFNLFETSYIIGSSYASFPVGTVHIIGVDIEFNKKNKPLVIDWNNHYFIATDNGILTLLTNKIKPKKIFEIYVANDTKLNEIDVFVKTACHLAKGGNLAEIGIEIDDLKPITTFQPTISDDKKVFKGMIIYFDNYNNAVTNITKDIFNEISNQRRFEINFKNKNIKTIFAKYSDVIKNVNFPDQFYDGHELAVFNEAGFLEIALYRSSPIAGSAKTMFGLNLGDVVSINFD